MIQRWLFSSVLGFSGSYRRGRLASAIGRGVTVTAAVYLIASVLPACQPMRPHGFITSSVLSQIQSDPVIRVRIVRGVSRVRLDGVSLLHIRHRDKEAAPQLDLALVTPVTVSRKRGVFTLRSANGQWVTWKMPGMLIESDSSEPIRVEGVSYAGRIVLNAIARGGKPTDRFDIVNHLLLEQYLPGVLSKELYPNWPLAAFKAQAVAARSYAIRQSARDQHRSFDLESTTASQAYGGANAHYRARKAARQTRGMVLTYRGEVLTAYYSSCCGGMGQDAAVAFPSEETLKPLEARHHGNWCSISSHYRWGPMIRSRGHLARRISAWGRARNHPVGGLKSIAAIAVTGRNRVGRPSQFTITDPTGRYFQIAPEPFRFACNYEKSGIDPLPKGSRLKSSHVEITVEGDRVLFVGQGFGHGVGMCQWGAYAMAKRGHTAKMILGYYYPGTRVERAYD